MKPSTTNFENLIISPKKTINFLDLPVEIIKEIVRFLPWKQSFLLKRLNRRFNNILTSKQWHLFPRVIELMVVEAVDFSTAYIIQKDGEDEEKLLFSQLNEEFFENLIVKKIEYISNNDVDGFFEYSLWLFDITVLELDFSSACEGYDWLQSDWLDYEPEVYKYRWDPKYQERWIRVPGNLKYCCHMSAREQMRHYRNTSYTRGWGLLEIRVSKLDNDEMVKDFVKAMISGKVQLHGEGGVWVENETENLSGLLIELEDLLSPFTKFTKDLPELEISEQELVFFVGQPRIMYYPDEGDEYENLFGFQLSNRPNKWMIGKGLDRFGVGYLI